VGADGPRFLALDGRLGVGTDGAQQALFVAEGLIRAHHRELGGRPASAPDAVYASLLRWLGTQRADAPPPRADGWLSSRPELYHRQVRDSITPRTLRSGLRGAPGRPVNNARDATVLVRCAPCALARLTPFELARHTALLTHSHPDAGWAAGCHAALLGKLVLGATLDEAAHSALQRLPDAPEAQEVGAVVEFALDAADVGEATAARLVDVLEFGGTDVEQARAVLGAALFAVAVTDDPHESLRLAMSAGGVASRLGAVVGQLVGALHGESALPAPLVAGARLGEVSRRVAVDLYDRFSGVPFELDEDAYDRYPGA
jgi:ADP-ribosylglycohydrolase